ncbi:MAG TPA: hypothetical protein DCR55_10865 [Lentisphaeria bacterium]|nr:hypothetical protein [Lentisphaeria bacterium]
MAGLIDQIEIANTQQPHCATVLLLDTSHSMTVGGRIDQLNEGIALFHSEVCEDELARKRVDLATVTFGERVEINQPFTPIEQFQPQPLRARGRTPMGAAIRQAIDMVQERKIHYKTLGVDYYRPWIFMLTDGEPTDMREGSEAWNETVQLIHSGEEDSKFLFFAVGVGDANMDVLHALSPASRPPLLLMENKFRSMFQWLSKSQTRVSSSRPGDHVELDDPTTGATAWARIET